MSLIDIDTLTPRHLIAQYVLECRGQGHFLPYGDYEVIDEWLRYSSDTDLLLLLLSELLPPFFESQSESKNPPSLKRLRRKVLGKLKDHAMRHSRSAEPL